MKGFKDLHFELHPTFNEGGHYRAVINFENGSSMSIISGRIFYTNRTLPYEIMVYGVTSEFLNEHDLSESHGIIGYCSANDVQQWMERLQML